MTKVLRQIAFVLSLQWLTGPILAKELRVSARRRRHFVLRTLYVLALLGFVVVAWLAYMPGAYGSHGYGRYRALSLLQEMPRAGMWIVATLVWFQYCAAVLMAIILPANAVSDEIYHRTLGVLLTTPITSLQIVMGKMLSKLSQVLLLLAMSLPVIIIIRSFGGVPWEFVQASLALTLSTVLFFASVSLFFSIFNRHSYVVILATILIGAFVFILLPLLGGWFMIEVLDVDGRTMQSMVGVTNPIFDMAALTAQLNPWGGPGFTVHWGACSLFLTAVSAGILAASVALVRRAALKQMLGRGGGDAPAPLPVTVRTPALAAPGEAIPALLTEGSAGPPPLPPPPIREVVAVDPDATLRRVWSWPVLWRELRRPMIRNWIWRLVIGIATGVILLLTYAIVAVEEGFDGTDSHILFVIVLFTLGVLATLTASAACITMDKEARCWPMLLMTTLPFWSIVVGKAAGVFRRVAPVWVLLAAHLVLFTGVGLIHPIVSVQLLLIVTYTIVFLTGSGMYFSSLFKRTTTAVVLNLGLALVVFLGVPMLAGRTPSRIVNAANPFVQIVAATERLSGRRAGRSMFEVNYRLGGVRLYLPEFTTLLLASAMGYGGLGVGFMALSTLHFRRRMG